MEEDLCPVCGINSNELETHLQNHSKEEIIAGFSCKSEPNSSVYNIIPVEGPSTTCSETATTQKTTPSTFTPIPNAYNTVFLPMNLSNYGMQTVPQFTFPFAMQQKASPGNRFPVQSPLLYMPQNMFPNLMAQNIPPFQAPLKDTSTQVNLGSQTLNVVEPAFPVNSSPNVVQQQSFNANMAYPNLQEVAFQPMQVIPFYSQNNGFASPNLSLFGNNMYTAPIPGMVQFPGVNTMSPINAMGLKSDSSQVMGNNLNFTPNINSNESINILDDSNEQSNLNNTQENMDQMRQCYYVGDKEALISIGDDVKLILPKDILCKEEVLGEFLRDQLATAIASEVKTEAMENSAVEQNIDQGVDEKVLLDTEICSSTLNNETLNSPNKSIQCIEKSPKIDIDSNATPINLKTITNIKMDIALDNDRDSVQNNEVVILKENSVSENKTVEYSLQQSSSLKPITDINESQKPVVLKMFSKNSNVSCSNFQKEDFFAEKSIKCFSPTSESNFTDEDSKSAVSFDETTLDLTVDCKSEIYNINNNSNTQEDPLSLKSLETLEHSDSESPTLMQSTLQGLICAEEGSIPLLSSPRKLWSEFSISNSGDHINITLEKENSMLISAASFLPDISSPIKENCCNEKAVILKDENIDEARRLVDTECFLDPFASTSGIQKTNSALNNSLDLEEYDFEYDEAETFDSDPEIDQSHKIGLLFQWKCGTCQKSFKSLKEKLLHSGCHPDESNVKKENLVKNEPLVKVELNAFKEALCLKNETIVGEADDVIKQKLEILRSLFSCSLCFIKFKDQVSISEHMKTHSISELKCHTCNKQLKRFSQWTQHQLFHYGANKYECKHCGKRFERLGLLNVHMRKHTGQRPFKCKTCGKKFTVSGALKAHWLTHLKNQYVQCEICNKKVKNSCMTRHKKLHQSQKKQITFKKKLDYLCSTCDAVFQTYRKLIWHQETHKRWPCKCKFCGECFVHQSSLTKHIRLKHDSKHVPYGEKKGVSVACVICNKMYTSSSLILHMRIHNGYKPFKCLVCSKNFSVKCNLVNHMWVHAGGKERPYKCNLCEKSYSRKSFLESHIRSHKKIKPYTCNECGKAFTYKTNLMSHIKDHFEEKQHLCSYCGKAFYRKYNLKDHVRIHTGETPFSCTICNKEFTQKSNYNVHIKAFHVERHVLDEEV